MRFGITLQDITNLKTITPEHIYSAEYILKYYPTEWSKLVNYFKFRYITRMPYLLYDLKVPNPDFKLVEHLIYAQYLLDTPKPTRFDLQTLAKLNAIGIPRPTKEGFYAMAYLISHGMSEEEESTIELISIQELRKRNKKRGNELVRWRILRWLLSFGNRYSSLFHIEKGVSIFHSSIEQHTFKYIDCYVDLKLRLLTVFSRFPRERAISLKIEGKLSNNALSVISQVILDYGAGRYIKELDLSDCGLDDSAIEALDYLLKVNTTITELKLEENNLSTKGLLALAKSLRGNDSLKTLYLKHNHFKDLDFWLSKDIEKRYNNLIRIDTLISLLKKHPSLQILDLGYMSFLKDDQELITWSLERNQFTFIEFARLRYFLESDKYFSKLNLNDCFLSDEDLSDLAKALNRNDRLTDLNLENNCQTVTGCTQFINILKNDTSLRKLNLKSNYIPETEKKGLRELALKKDISVVF